MSRRDFQPSRYLAPRYWPTWLALGLLRLMIVPPYAWQVRMGAGLGHLFYLLGIRRRRIAATNIARCFPDLSPGEQKALLRRNFRATGLAVQETLLAWWGRDETLRSLVEIEGLEHLEAARARGKGVLLLGAHFTSLEISGRLLSRFHPVHAMYRRHNNPLMEAIIKHAREGFLEGLVERRDMRRMIRLLREGQVVWYAPDQDFGSRGSVFAPFFGIQTASLLMTSKLARVSGAPVLPFFSQHTEDNRGYRLIIRPPLEDFPSGDDVADAARVNAIIEEQVRKAPEEYLWVHKRFKTRPPGEAPFYER